MTTSIHAKTNRIPARRRGFLVALSCAIAAVPAQAAADQSVEHPEIPFERHVLPNGLTLILHEDHSSPLVAVNVWYHVGSKDETPGRTGIAHLFEHLMFTGSEHAPGDYFMRLEAWGATDVNGTTDPDRTNFFQTVPSSALDAVLWMESERMGHLVGGVDQARLDDQLGVVRNEKLEGANQPYGRAFDVIFANAYPQGHPYSWPITGNLDDLAGIDLDDVQEWHEGHYGAANAVLVLAGDIDPEAALQKVERHFGHIPAGPPVQRMEQWIAPRAESRRVVMQDQVPQAKLYKVWNVPGWGSLELTQLDLVTDLLASGNTSRLYRRLVEKDRVATEVSAFVIERELGSVFVVEVSGAPDEPLARLEAVLNDEIERFLAEGPSAGELERVRTQLRARFIREIERIGGFGGRSDVLAMNEVYTGRPDFYRTRLEWVAAATPETLRQTARHWLAKGDLVLEVQPHRQAHAVASVDHENGPPTPEAPPAPDFPDLQRATLSNGLEVVVARRASVPLVDLRLIVNAGYSADAVGIPGTTRMALDLLRHGTTNRSGQAIGEALDALGATFRAASDLDVSVMTLTALKENLDASAELFADLVLNPAFPEAAVDWARASALAEVGQEQLDPVTAAFRLMGKLVYGDGHPYAVSLTGSGTDASVVSITRETLQDFHSTWFRPNNATIVVAGATTLEAVLPKLEQVFGAWKAGPVPERTMARIAHRDEPVVYVLDHPAADQTAIVVGHLGPPKANPEELAIQTTNAVLGDFVGRVNMNLREDKGWTYGMESFFMNGRGQRLFLVIAPVQANQTGPALEVIRSELEDIAGDRPVTGAELDRVRQARVLSLPGSLETNRDLLNAVTEIVEFGLPDDHFDALPDRVRSLDLARVRSAAREHIRPRQTVWVVVGDKRAIESEVLTFSRGPVYEIDVDGNVKSTIATARRAGPGRENP